jgi:hypothetical protein
MFWSMTQATGGGRGVHRSDDPSGELRESRPGKDVSRCPGSSVRQTLAAARSRAPRGQKLKIRKLNARLFFPQPESIYLASADARIFDVQVFAAGRLINPQAFRSQMEGRALIPPEWFERVLEEIESVKFESEPPVVDIKFSGDLAHPEKISFDVALWGERIRRRHHVIKNLYASVSCRDGIIDLRQLTATDAFGELIATGRMAAGGPHGATPGAFHDRCPRPGPRL